MFVRRRTVSVAALAAVAVTAGLSACSQAPTQAPGSTSTPAASTASAAPAIHGYEFPGGMIEGASGGGQLYTRVEGLVALPSTPGPHPVAVLIHGSYPSCLDVPNEKLFTPEVLTTPWPEGCGTERVSTDVGISRGPDYLRTPAGFAYLANALAEKGVAVMIPDVNTKERLDWGGEPDTLKLQSNIANTHLGLLEKLNSGDALGLPWGADAKGAFDLSHVALIGHSSGGGFVVDANQTQSIPNIKAVVAIEPGFQHVAERKGEPAPTLVIEGECDEQLSSESVREGISEVAKANTAGVVLSAVVPHATHIGTLFGGGDNTVGLVQPPSTPGCKPDALLPKPVQRATMAQLTTDFITQTLAGNSTYTLNTAPGAKATAKAETSKTQVTVGVSEAATADVTPTSVQYSTSTHQVLPAKPDSLVLFSKKTTVDDV